MWQIVIKGLPVFIGLLLSFGLPYVLQKRTHELARSGNLEDNKEKAKTLDYLLGLRDLIIALLTGLFVLQFAVAQQITSKNVTLANIAPFVTIAIIPLMLTSIWFLTDKLGLEHIQSFHRILLRNNYKISKDKDRLPFFLVLSVILLVVLCYGFSLLFIYL